MPTDSTNSAPEKAPPEWADVFLLGLAETGNVTAAAELAEIDRSTAYKLRDRSADFRAAWDSAVEIAVDGLEAEARRRALASSDTLLIFLLKAHRPNKFRERASVEHSGEVKVTVEYADGDPPYAAEAPPGPD